MFAFIKNLFKKDKPKEEEVTMAHDLFTFEELYEINGNMNKANCEEYITALNNILVQQGINTPLRICHFLAQILHESGHLKYKVENLNYSAKALRSVFGKYFPNDQLAKEYERKPEKIANRVYANRMGNGNEASGEGWKFRGRGLIQLTGKTNYDACGKACGLNLIESPDCLIDYPENSILAACWFWNKNNLNQYADKDDIVTITKRINGGTNGIDDRKAILERAKKVLNV